jgi:hypothetical protein
MAVVGKAVQKPQKIFAQIQPRACAQGIEVHLGKSDSELQSLFFRQG